jgi:hypothetical protein
VRATPVSNPDDKLASKRSLCQDGLDGVLAGSGRLIQQRDRDTATHARYGCPERASAYAGELHRSNASRVAGDALWLALCAALSRHWFCLHLPPSRARPGPLSMPREARRPVHLPQSLGTGFACTFHGHWYGQHPTCFPRFRIALPSSTFLLRSGAVVILTSAARSGGEVRITEAQRPRHIRPGRRGCRAGIAAGSARMRGHGTVQPVCGVYRGHVRRSARARHLPH